MAEWNYLAGRLIGDGTIDVLESDLPIAVGSINRNLSAPQTLEGTITNEVKRLKVDGKPLFEPWNSVIIAEADGLIRGMAIYREPSFTGASWQLSTVGLGGYPSGQPYDGTKSYVQADPLQVFRDVWAHLQSRPDGNLGVTVDSLASAAKVGTAASTTDGSEGPFKLGLADSPDLGQTIDRLAADTPFDWLEQCFWDGDDPHCHVKLGQPSIGGRSPLYRFVLGENLATDPTMKSEGYANQVYVVGAGEGADAIKGYAGVRDGHIRRAKVISDTKSNTKAKADAVASRTLAANRGELTVDTIEVYDHPNAPLEAIELGNEYQLYVENDWTVLDEWVRVIGRSDAPGSDDRTTLTVVRTVIV